MKTVYLAHPLSSPTRSGVLLNLDRAKRWYKWACDHYWPDFSFNCMWVLNCEVYDDADAIQRSRGMQRNFAHIKNCDELWLVGEDLSGGMLDEAVFAHEECRIPVYNLTGFQVPPPVAVEPSSMTKWKPGPMSQQVLKFR